MPDSGSYPATAAARDRFVLERRGPRPQHDPWRYQGLIVEDERAADGGRSRVWRPCSSLAASVRGAARCAICGLHHRQRHAARRDSSADGGRAARTCASEPRPVTGMKLYNAGSFFDPRAVPEADYDGVAARARRAVARDRRIASRARGPARRSAARGARPPSGPGGAAGAARSRDGPGDSAPGRARSIEQAIHARASSRGRQRARTIVAWRCASFCSSRRRLFLRTNRTTWLLRSIDAAFSCGAAVVSLVPTRGRQRRDRRAGRGRMVPRARSRRHRAQLRVRPCGHARGRGRVFVDLWDLERFAAVLHIASPRVAIASRR